MATMAPRRHEFAVLNLKVRRIVGAATVTGGYQGDMVRCRPEAPTSTAGWTWARGLAAHAAGP